MIPPLMPVVATESCAKSLNFSATPPPDLNSPGEQGVDRDRHQQQSDKNSGINPASEALQCQPQSYRKREHHDAADDGIGFPS
jgi:hypothetical protein